MQGPDKRAIVVRGPEGLVQKVEPIKKKTGILTWPLIRGVVNFGSSMVNGVKALMYSADCEQQVAIAFVAILRRNHRRFCDEQTAFFE